MHGAPVLVAQCLVLVEIGRPDWWFEVRPGLLYPAHPVLRHHEQRLIGVIAGCGLAQGSCGGSARGTQRERNLCAWSFP